MVSSLLISILLCSYIAVLPYLELCPSFYLLYFKARVCPFLPWLAYSGSFPGLWTRSDRLTGWLSDGPSHSRRDRNSRCRPDFWRTLLTGWETHCRAGTDRSSCTGRSIRVVARSFSLRVVRGPCGPCLWSHDRRQMKHPRRRSRTRPHTTGTAQSDPYCARGDHLSYSRKSEYLHTMKDSSWSGSQSSGDGLALNGLDAYGFAGELGLLRRFNDLTRCNALHRCRHSALNHCSSFH